MSGHERLQPPRTHHARHALVALLHALRRGLNEIDQLGRVLDYGCGDQPYRALIDERGGVYVGADLPGNGRVDVSLGPSGALPLADGSVDTVFSTQVIEHVDDPAMYLAEARRVLRPGGNILLSTHGVWTYHPHPEDYWRWTGAGLSRLLQASGFEIVSFEGVMNAAGAGLQLWQDSVLKWMPRLFHAPFVLLVQGVIALHDHFGTPETRSSDAAIYVVCGRATSRPG